MSNTASVTPYQDNSSTAADHAAVIGQVLSAIAETFAATDAERETLSRYRELARTQRLGVARLDDRIGNHGDLIAGASRLGFVVARPTLRGTSKARGLPADRPVELINPKGDSLLIRDGANGLAILSSSGESTIHAVVRQVTLGRVERYLTGLSGSPVVSRQLASGETELLAREAQPLGKGQAVATLTARVAGTGVVHLDIAGLQGRSCEQVLDDMAQAVGGQVNNLVLKADYYAAPATPGEPVHVGKGV